MTQEADENEKAQPGAKGRSFLFTVSRLITPPLYLLAGIGCGIVAHVNAEEAWTWPNRGVSAIVWAIFAATFLFGSAILAKRSDPPS